MDDLTRERFDPPVPSCPHCGHQPANLGRYKVIRPHGIRLVRNGRIATDGTPCPGAGLLPELMSRVDLPGSPR